ncbi:hypothetical protein LCGC14_1191940 [marine sediment metagenome]|uniref:Uncharacterized protein n=1 Tax=marine sediment metagenome TaxID=412755 RepID=A0A0F9PPF9_9ZZZZ
MRVAEIITVHPVSQPEDVKYIFVGEDGSRLGEAGRTLKRGIYYQGDGGKALRGLLGK